MSRNHFLRNVRAITARTSITRRSHKEAVLGVLAVYLRSVARDYDDQTAREEEIVWARRAVSTIYCPSDPTLPAGADWQLPLL